MSRPHSLLHFLRLFSGNQADFSLSTPPDIPANQRVLKKMLLFCVFIQTFSRMRAETYRPSAAPPVSTNRHRHPQLQPNEFSRFEARCEVRAGDQWRSLCRDAAHCQPCQSVSAGRDGLSNGRGRRVNQRPSQTARRPPSWEPFSGGGRGLAFLLVGRKEGFVCEATARLGCLLRDKHLKLLKKESH